MPPTFHKSYKFALSPANGSFKLTLANKPVRQKGDDNTADSGNKPANERGGNLFNELAHWILLSFAVLIGAGFALLLFVPIQCTFNFLMGISERVFGRHGV
jgi:hypothetical protein